MYLVLGGVTGPRGCSWSGGYLVRGVPRLGGVPGPGGCTCSEGGVPGLGGTWSRGGVPGREVYLVWGGVPGPGGVPGQVLPPCEQNHTHL